MVSQDSCLPPLMACRRTAMGRACCFIRNKIRGCLLQNAIISHIPQIFLAPGLLNDLLPVRFSLPVGCIPWLSACETHPLPPRRSRLLMTRSAAQDRPRVTLQPMKRNSKEKAVRKTEARKRGREEKNIRPHCMHSTGWFYRQPWHLTALAHNRWGNRTVNSFNPNKLCLNGFARQSAKEILILRLWNNYPSRIKKCLAVVLLSIGIDHCRKRNWIKFLF